MYLLDTLYDNETYRFLDINKDCSFVPGAYAVFDKNTCKLSVILSPRLN